MRLRLVSPAAALAVSGTLILNLLGCGGGGSRPSGSSTGSDFPTVAVAGKVILPGGNALGSGAFVTTAFGKFPVKSDGTFTATVADALPSLVTVSQGANELMMAMFGKDRPTVDASAEALALVLLRTGLGALPYDALKPIVLQGGDADAVQTLATALGAHASGNPTFPDLAKASATEIAVASAAFVAGPGSRGVIIDPSKAKSGLTVVQTTLNKVAVMNAYRRRGVAYIDRIGYLPAGSPPTGDETPSPAETAMVDVPPTVGVTSVIGGYYDVIKGNVAYAPVTSAETSLPNTPVDAKYTHYQVTVAGLGSSAGDKAKLSQARQQDLLSFQISTLFLDLIVPAFSNLILGGLAVKFTGSNDDLANGLTLARTFASAVVSGSPALAQLSDQGDVVGAMKAGIDLVVTDSTFQGLFTKLCVAVVGSKLKGQAAASFAALLPNVLSGLSIGDVAFAAADLAAVAHDVAASNQVDTFDVKTTTSKIKLTPAHAETSGTNEVPLKATLLDAAPGETGISFAWTVTGTGNLHDGNSFGSSITETDGNLSFRPTLNQTGTATVTVHATKANTDGTTSDLGTESATIEVEGLQVLLLPMRQSVKPNGTATYSAKVVNDPTGGAYLYRFSTSGNFGTISGGGQVSSAPSATYTAKSAEGKDDVTVEAYRLDQGTPVEIATATGEARVEQTPTIIFGTLDIIVEPLDPGRSGVTPVVRFSPVSGATQYNLHGYGGNDTAYYGTNIYKSLGPPFVSETEGGTVQNAYSLAGFAGGSQDIGTYTAYYHARFDGFTWEIEVIK